MTCKLTDIEARQIAGQYALEMGEVLSGFRLGIGNEENFTDKYYFDFNWLTLDGQIPKEPPIAGGARGLTVDKQNGQVQVITYGDYTILIAEEKRLGEVYQLLTDFKNGKKHLTEVKAKFDLNSEQLLELSKVIKETDLIKEETYAIINRLLERGRNSR